MIKPDGEDLSFITVSITDENGLTVPDASNELTFSIEGPGEIIATDNGDAADMTAFPSKIRKAFAGKALVIVQSQKGKSGSIKVTATADGLQVASIWINVN
uniref:CAZy families GH2 protein n=1 Tax=uncultured Podospora TaxID=613079 RepID=A0A060C0R8_9PEZI|nr:CAZy families GH2 protein [uncultured Podospora]